MILLTWWNNDHHQTVLSFLAQRILNVAKRKMAEDDTWNWWRAAREKGARAREGNLFQRPKLEVDRVVFIFIHISSSSSSWLGHLFVVCVYSLSLSLLPPCYLHTETILSPTTDSLHRRNHKERSQPLHRAKLGLLEKHKDYVHRARDYKSKRERLKKLKEKIAFRNKDEFYWGMVKGKTEGGVHIQGRGNEPLPVDVVRILKTQDANYIRTQIAAEESVSHKIPLSISTGPRFQDFFFIPKKKLTRPLSEKLNFLENHRYQRTNPIHSRSPTLLIQQHRWRFLRLWSWISSRSDWPWTIKSGWRLAWG